MSDPAPYGPQPAWPYQPPASRLPDLRWPIDLLYWATPDVTFSQDRSALITNSPLAAGLFYGTRSLGNAAARRKARQLAAPQWLLAGSGEVAPDERGIALSGSWGTMRLEYAEVVSWERDQDALQITPVDYYPLLLRSPGIDDLAGWYGHLSHGKLWQPLAMQTWQPQPGLRVSFWEQRDTRFICAVPEEWEPLTDPGYLSNVAQDAANNQQRLLFMLRRNAVECGAAVDFNEIVNPAMVSFLSSDPASLEQDALRFAGTKAERSNGTVVTRPRVVLMDGERATVIDTTMKAPHVRVRICELYVGRRGRWFMIGFAVAHAANPQPFFERLLPEFQTMVATWKWRY